MHFKNSLKEKYKINKISEVSKDQLSDFYKKTYYKRYKSLTNNWRWWYRVGHTKFEPIIVSIENKVIGQAAFLPTELNIEEKKIHSIWFVDYAILPEFKGKGLGKLMYKEWRKICPNQMAICSDDSLRVLTKFGWKANFETKRLARPINALNFLPVAKNLNLKLINKSLVYFVKRKFERKISINPYKISDNFRTINDSFKLKKNLINSNFASIVRDEKWLQWRLMECPHKKDLYFFEYKNNFAIVHIFFNYVKRLNILYTYSIDQSQEKELHVHIMNWAIKNNIDLVWEISNTSSNKSIFPKLFNKPLKFAAWSSDESTLKILQNGLLDLQGIDTDTDSCLYID